MKHRKGDTLTIDANIRNDATGPESYRLGLDAALKEAIQAFVDVRFVPEDELESTMFGNATLERATFEDAAVEDASVSASNRGYSAPTFARNMLTTREPEMAGSAPYVAAPARNAVPPRQDESASRPAPAKKRRGGVIGSVGRAIGELARKGKHAEEFTEARADKASDELADELVSERAAGIGLREWLDEVDAPFSTTLLRLIDERGYDDVDVYKRAGMSRQLFSRIRSDAAYRPAKKTVLALAVALRLNVAEARDLLERAGFALSHSDKRDLVVEYFLENGRHDLMAVNQALYEFDQPLL